MSPFFGLFQGRGSSAREQHPRPPPTTGNLAAGEWFDDEPSLSVASSPARSRTWFLRDHLSSMPSLREPTNRRPASRSQEELQLCGDYTNPPDAVTISKPTVTAGGSMPHSSKPGARSSFTPRNTLRHSPYHARPSTAPNGSKHTHAGSLQLEPGRGDNVRQARAHKFPDDDMVSYKRQKLSHPKSSSPPVVDLTDEGSPPLKSSPLQRSRPHTYEQARDHFSQFRQSRSNGSIQSRPSLQSMPSGSDEFKRVDGLMNPRGYGSAHISQEPLGQGHFRAASSTGKQPTTIRGQSSEPIEVVSDDDLQRKKDPGREKFIMDALMDQLTEPSGKRKLFGQSLSNDRKQPSGQGEASYNNGSHSSSQRRLAQGNDRDAAKGNVGSRQVYGLRMNPATAAASNDDSEDDSADELSQEVPRALPKQREQTIRQFDAAEKKQTRSHYFSEPMDVDHAPPHSRRFPESNVVASKVDIKPAAFTSKGSKNTSQNSSRKANCKSRQWPLKLFKIPNSPAIADVGMHLVWEPEMKRFGVHGKDGIIPIGKGVSSVEASKVNKIVYGKDDSTKVLVHGPMTDGEIYKRLMEFTNTEDRDDFMTALHGTIKRVERSGGDIDKIFAKADENPPRKSISKPVDAGVERAVLESRDNLRRQETIDLNGNKERNHDKSNTNSSTNGRPRPDTRLISQMQSNPSRAESSTRTSRATRANDQPDIATSRTLAATRSTRANECDDQTSNIESVETTAEPKNSWPPMWFPREWKQPLVYPPTGRQRAQVDWADLFKLVDDEFLNDSIISFYMTWAAKQAEEQGNLRPDKVYWFNTYFYSTLTKLARGQKGINYAGVQRWTSKVDIFSYDYVVVPINEDQHWYLAIICNLPALAKKVQNQEEDVAENDAEIKDLPKDGMATQVHGVLSEKQEPPSESTKGSEDAGDAMEVDQPARSDGATGDEKFGDQSNGARDGDETMAMTPQLIADEARNDVLEEIKVLPDGQEDTSKLSPGGKKGRKKQGPPSRKLDVDQPVIIMLDSLELTHPRTTKNLKAYLVEEGNAKRGMDIDMKALQGTTAKCIPSQDNFCDCGIFVCLYFQKFINDADNFVHRIFRREMDKTKDWPDICPPKTRREILELLLQLEEEQSKERNEQKRKKKEEKRRLLEGVEDESSTSIPKQSSPSKMAGHEHGPKTPSGSPPPGLPITKTVPEAGLRTRPTPLPRAVTPKLGRNPMVVIQASPVKDTAANANPVPNRRSPRKRTSPAETTGYGEQDTAVLCTDGGKRRGPSVELGDDDLAIADAEVIPSIENRHLQLHEQDYRDGGILYHQPDDQMEVEEAGQDEAEREIPDSPPYEFEVAAQGSHQQWQLSLLLGNTYEGKREAEKGRSPSQRRRQQQRKKKSTSMEVIEIDDSQA